MTATHFPWCDPPSCDVDAEGYSAHRSRVVELKTFQGVRECYLYATSLYNGAPPTVCIGRGDDLKAYASVPLPTLVLFMAELESLQQPRVVSEA